MLPRRRWESDVQRPAGGHRGILLAYCSGGGVPRIGERGLAGLLERAIQLRERRARHEHLPAQLEFVDFGEPSPGDGRNAPDGAEIRRDVLADTAVAPRGSADEPAPLVQERHSEAIDLRLADIRELRPPKGAAHSRLELPELIRADHVVEREHGDAVLDRLERLGRRSRDALRGAIGRDEIGKA